VEGANEVIEISAEANMRYFVVAALTALLFLVSCGQGKGSFTETPEAVTPEAQEPEAQAPHPSLEQSADPDRIAKMKEENKKQEEQEAAENERSKLGHSLDSLYNALQEEKNVEKAKQITAEIALLYEKFRKEDEGPDATLTDIMNKFKQQLDKLTSYLERNDVDNAKTCTVNLAYCWRDWKMHKMVR
jgi:hypothetical protein